MTDPIKLAVTDYDPDSEEARMARSGRIIAEQSTEENPLIGHVTIGVYKDGGYSCGYFMPSGDESFFRPTLFTAFIKEVIAREMTGALAADDYAREYLL